MNLIPNKTPGVLKQFFYSYTWDFFAENEKKLYLTFDDGPNPEVTPFVLEQLSQYKAKATFFCIGENIQKHPHIFNQILLEGHAVGNHTTNHLKAWRSDIKTYIKNVEDCQNILTEHSGNLSTQKIFRPPYGQISYSKFKLLEKLGYKIILWDVLSKDWEQATDLTICLQNVIQNTQSGSIVVFHDSVKASKNLTFTLPKVLANFTEKGFVFEKIEF